MRLVCYVAASADGALFPFQSLASLQSPATKAMCNSVCSVPSCADRMFRIGGPTLDGYGCCEKATGTLKMPFALWKTHPAGVDYGLVPKRDELQNPTERRATWQNSISTCCAYFSRSQRTESVVTDVH